MCPPDSTTLLGSAYRLFMSPMQALGSCPSRVYLNLSAGESKLRLIGFVSTPTSHRIPVLSPSSFWFPSDFVLLLPRLGPFSLYIDGSWAPTRSSHSHVTGKDPIYLRSTGLTIFSDLPHWRELPFLILNITNSQDLGAISEYSMEVLGLLVGLSLAAHFPETAITICSDCQAAVRKLHKNRFHATLISTKTCDASLLGAAILH